MNPFEASIVERFTAVEELLVEVLPTGASRAEVGVPSAESVFLVPTTANDPFYGELLQLEARLTLHDDPPHLVTILPQDDRRVQLPTPLWNESVSGP